MLKFRVRLKGIDGPINPPGGTPKTLSNEEMSERVNDGLAQNLSQDWRNTSLFEVNNSGLKKNQVARNADGTGTYTISFDGFTVEYQDTDKNGEISSKDTALKVTYSAGDIQNQEVTVGTSWIGPEILERYLASKEMEGNRSMIDLLNKLQNSVNSSDKVNTQNNLMGGDSRSSVRVSLSDGTFFTVKDTNKNGEVDTGDKFEGLYRSPEGRSRSMNDFVVNGKKESKQSIGDFVKANLNENIEQAKADIKTKNDEIDKNITNKYKDEE